MIRRFTNLISIIVTTILPCGVLALEPADIPIDKLAYDEWYGIYLKGEKLGYVHLRSRPPKRDGGDHFVSEIEMKMSVSVGNRQVWRKMVGAIHYSREKCWRRIDAISVTIDASGQKTICKESLKGDLYEVRKTYRGGSKVKTVPQPSQSLLDAFRVELDCIRGVETGHIGKFITWSADKCKDEVSTYEFKEIGERVIQGKKTRVAHVTVTDVLGDSADKKYEMGTGRLIEVVFPEGFAYRLESKREATDPSKLTLKLNEIFVYTDREIKTSKRERTSSCKLFLPDLTAKDMPENERAQCTEVDGGLEIKVTCETFSPNRGLKENQIAENIRRFRKEEPLIQSENPEIIQCAKTIVDGLESTYEKAAMINAWVHENIKGVDVKHMDALETLRTKKGACTAISNLAIALARAAGIPAQDVGGIVYVIDPPKRFAQHAWVKYYIAGQWIEMDPTLGLDLVDASYIEMPTECVFQLLGETIKVLKVTTQEPSSKPAGGKQ